MRLFKSAGLFLVLLLSTQSHAGFLVEPLIGYGFGSGEYARSGITTRESSENGVQFGARLGYQMLGLMGGLEFRKSSGSYSFDGPTSLNLANQTDADYSGTEFGAFVGYNLPILLRAYIGYTFSTKWELDGNSWRGGNGDELSGNTTTLGVGFTGLPFVSLNLEYRMTSFDKWTDVSDNNNKITVDETNNQIVLGASIPFDL
ncbi:outer membrane beta-barrel protein [Halobacteriovorax sp. HLS]|uniref:outer membrane beta-barrel protein n=1 Tax=Halobacteriovorax sp. HLS TaxID=2234000 RepID=UPI000FD91F5B|nr:outer membrane beta-barrel protein [Halobacteriovorax sp. HLS]